MHYGCAVLQEMPVFLKEEVWLRTQLVRAWGELLTKPGQQGTRSAYFAVVTQCYMHVARDQASGGVKETDATFPVAVCAWMAAVLTAMLHVPGAMATK